MRQALEDRPAAYAGMATATPTTIPAPIKGWNLIDPLQAMDPEYAILLDNWIPRQGWIEPRKGQVSWATGFSGPIYSLIPYVGGATKKLFAASGTGIFDVTVAGAISASVQTISQSKGWISQQISTLGGTYVTLCNGIDPVLYFDGTTWTVSAITGVTPANLFYVTDYQGSLWYAEVNSLHAWYLAPGAITGAATLFDLGPQAKMGGKLVAIATWSIEAGYGPTDLLVFLTSEGEVLVYQGIDPSQPATFSIVGTYRIPKPFGTNPLLRYAGDMLVLTQQGVYPLSKALQSATINRTSAITYTISPQFAADIAQFGVQYGWQMTLFTEDNLLLVNAPEADTGLPAQYVMNTITGAWCRFRGVNAHVFCDFNGSLYFAGHNGSNVNIVGKMAGPTDFSIAINTGLITAYNYLEARGANKQIKLIRPNFVTDAPIVLYLAVSTDYQQLVQYQYAAMSFLLNLLSNGGIWDVTYWDQCVWQFSSFTPLQWKSLNNFPGWALGVGLQTQSKNDILRLVCFDLIFEAGGML